MKEEERYAILKRAQEVLTNTEQLGYLVSIMEDISHIKSDALDRIKEALDIGKTKRDDKEPLGPVHEELSLSLITSYDNTLNQLAQVVQELLPNEDEGDRPSVRINLTRSILDIALGNYLARIEDGRALILPEDNPSLAVSISAVRPKAGLPRNLYDVHYGQKLLYEGIPYSNLIHLNFKAIIAEHNK